MKDQNVQERWERTKTTKKMKWNKNSTHENQLVEKFDQVILLGSFGYSLGTGHEKCKTKFP